MKKLVFALCSATALISAPALAADLRMPMKAAPVAMLAPIANRNGFYIGGHLGGVFTGSDTFGSRDASGVIGGAQIGYNWQTGPMLVGLEVSGSGSSLTTPAPLGRLNALFTATGRLGYTFDRALLYVKGGYAGTGYRGILGADPDWGHGFTVGGGIEYLIMPNVSIGAEYSYIRTTRDVRFPAAVTVTNFRDDLHKVVARVNYLFNWGSAPVSARY